MGDNNKDTKQGKCIEDLFPDIPGCSEEDLLDEYEAACNLDIPLLNAEASSEEFEKIWSRIQAERADSADTADSQEPTESDESGHGKIIRVRFSWKRLAAVGVIACLLAGSGCMVAMGTKSYFYRERTDELIGNEVRFNNDMNKVAVNGEEEAYALIENELNIKPLRLSYIPANMEFSNIEMRDGYVNIEFLYENKLVYFIQSKYEKRVSYNINSDSNKDGKMEVYNKWLRKTLKINKEIRPDGNIMYETFLIVDGACYSLIGNVEEDIFQKMAKELSF